MKVAWHLEPYAGRTAASTVADIEYINAAYGDHPAFHRSARHGNKSAFHVFQSLDIADRSALDQVTDTSIVLAQTTDTSKIAHFSYGRTGTAAETAYLDRTALLVQPLHPADAPLTHREPQRPLPRRG